MTARRPLGLAAAFLLPLAAVAADVEEKYPNGNVKARYTVDAQKRKQGAYTEYTERGQKKLAAVYKDGKLSGAVVHFDKGKEVWRQAFRDGRPAFGRTPEQVRKTLAELDPEPGPAAAADDAADREAGLRRLKAYRYICDVPFDTLALDPELNKLCDAGSRLCERIGKLDHTPPNPGLPEAEYKTGYRGTSSSNLAQGTGDLRSAVDLWMDDSDPGNIDRVGHRRWCLDPPMQRTGLGRAGAFTAMWTMDTGQRAVPDYALVAYPAAGYTPAEYFGPRHAWSVSFHPRKYKVGAGAKAAVYEVDELLRRGEPLKLDYNRANLAGFAIPNCVIFRPESADLSAGRRYLVEVEGVVPLGTAPAPIYVVEFMALK